MSKPLEVKDYLRKWNAEAKLADKKFDDRYDGEAEEPRDEPDDSADDRVDGPTWHRYLPKNFKPSKTVDKFNPKRSGGTRIAVIPDTHVPRQDHKAWSTALSLVKEFKPDSVVIIGDFADLESLSHHPKNRPDLTKLATEYYEANIALDLLQGSAPSAKFYYLEGNHEYRSVKYVNAFPHLDGLLSVPENLYITSPGTPRTPGSTQLPHRYTKRVNVNLRGITWLPFRNYLRRAWVAPWGIGYLHSAKGNGSWGGGGLHHAAYHANNIGPVSGCKVTVYGHHHSFQHFRSVAGFEAYCSGFLGDFDADEPAFDYAGGPSPWVTGMLFQTVAGSLVSTEEVYIRDGKAIHRDRVFG